MHHLRNGISHGAPIPSFAGTDVIRASDDDTLQCGLADLSGGNLGRHVRESSDDVGSICTTLKIAELDGFDGVDYGRVSDLLGLEFFPHHGSVFLL